PGPALGAAPAQPAAPGPGQPRAPGLPRRGGLRRGRDAVADRVDPRGVPGLRRPVATPARLLLRAAPEPAAAEAAAYGGRRRPLLPDRPLPARRGPAGGS